MKVEGSKPMVLVILDGFGCGKSTPNNAITLADTPVWDSLMKNSAYTELTCSGSVVGLPDKQMGNSEVGHLHLGSGRLLPQDYTRINTSLENGAFQTNAVFCEALDQAQTSGKAVHIVGLLSSGGVHSHEDHVHALVELAVNRGNKNIFVHAFLDGRDTFPKCAADSVDKMEAVFNRIGAGKLVSVIGRFFAMDRDNRWDRVQKAYDLIVQGVSEFRCKSAAEAVCKAYERGETDEFVKSTAIVAEGDEPTTIEAGDVVIFMNFRADRVRQLVRAISEPGFHGFAREKVVQLGALVTLTPYHYTFNFPVVFPRKDVVNGFGEYLSTIGLTQLRLAETEKYAHVTFFFNGGIEEPFPGESRILIPSPKVTTYDQQPEMSAEEVTDQLVEALESRKYDIIICNYANCDMVGHTGDIPAAVVAVETVDMCLGRVLAALDRVEGQILITADHGNVEQMVDPVSGQSLTSHTLNPVPLVYYGGDKSLATGGNLADVAPTMLEIMGLNIPAEMSGRSLLQ